ncbi:MAG: ABC transporter substrate-binding protein [Treponema sp.]|nr:ABC transporter substrate-binding protein [Treponema sp.]
MKSISKMIIAGIIVSAVLIGVFAGCNRDSGDSGRARNGIPITLLATAGGENDFNLNMMRGFLTDAGFVVNVNIQPDFASWVTQVDAGNYDLALTGWTTVTGNPDYAVRSLFHSDGDSNRNGINNRRLDELIELAASQTPAEYVRTYTDMENVLVTDNAFYIPFYRNIRTLGVNTSVMRRDSVFLFPARSQNWEMNDYVNTALRETRPIMMSQGTGNLTSLDPVRANDGSINQLNSNINVRLVNLDSRDAVIPDGSLSWQYVIAQGNQDFYFVLRDDIHFARVVNNAAVNTGVRVGAEDVVFSLNRARDRTSVPDHRTFSLHESMNEISIVTDISLLESVRDSDTGRTLRQVMEQNTPTPIRTLTANKTQANNAQGVYQIVRVRTRIPFPQVLNYLAHQSAGIINEQQVMSINNFPVASYDRSIHTLYGDQAALTPGPTFNHHLWASGPYIPLYKNDYEIHFERNPGYMPGTNWAPKVRYVNMRFITDKDAEIAAFRSGETDLLFTVPPDRFDLITSNPDLDIIVIPSHAASYWLPNLNGVLSDVNLRLAVLYSVNQDDIMAFYQGRYFKSYSTLSSLMDTGNVLIHDMARVDQHLNRHWEGR